MTGTRRKGAAIVDTKEGILVVAGRSKRYILPGGGANNGESRKKAAISPKTNIAMETIFPIIIGVLPKCP